MSVDNFEERLIEVNLDLYYELKDRVEDTLRVAEMFEAPRGVIMSLRASKQEIINTMANYLTGSTRRAIRQELDEEGNIVNVLAEWGEEDLRNV